MAVSALYPWLGKLFPTRDRPARAPRRIVLIRPCCIGDVVMATAALQALQAHYPKARITWAVGGWSKEVAALWQPEIDLLDTGAAANPAANLGGFVRLVRGLRGGGYDLAVVLSRSPLMSLAVALSGIPWRAGLDSAGRGFGYNLRVPIDPATRHHEVDIYLSVAEALGAKTAGIVPRVPVAKKTRVPAVAAPYLVVNPSGGHNPGGRMDAKRYPAHWLAQIVNTIAPGLGIEQVVVVAGPGDKLLAMQVQANLHRTLRTQTFVGTLSFAQIAKFAANARLYIGNDTGLTHLAAAAGGRVAMLLGPTDPARYRAYAPDAITLWREVAVSAGGFVGGVPPGWTWDANGIAPDEAAGQILAALGGADN